MSGQAEPGAALPAALPAGTEAGGGSRHRPRAITRAFDPPDLR